MGSYSAHHLRSVSLPALRISIIFHTLLLSAQMCASVKRNLWRGGFERSVTDTSTQGIRLDQHKQLFLAGMPLNGWFLCTLHCFSYMLNIRTRIMWPFLDNKQHFFLSKLILKSSSDYYMKRLELFALPLDYWVLFMLHKDLRVFCCYTGDIPELF